jgi:hypothetical protein
VAHVARLGWHSHCFDVDSTRKGGVDMADDPSKRGMSDRTRINLEQEYEVRHAMTELGVTREELEAAVRKVGNQRADVEAELRRSKGR